MWVLWVCLGLVGLVVGQWLLFRRDKAQWQEQLHSLQQTLTGQEALLSAQKALCAQKEAALEALTTQLAQKEATMESLTAQLAQTQAQLEALTPRPKLYLPDDEPAQAPPVYYNENTGIYHTDRACAPYQAILLAPEQLPPHARPCKKCAEGHPFPAPPEATQEEDSESQLCLFDLN